MATTRPLVSVHSAEDGAPTSTSLLLPSVFCSPLRPDLVRYVHSNLGKNRRQPYGVSPSAGYQTSAESWGTGRAVARIPRVPGGGTHRAGQAAFGNMCRGGGMFAPNKTWRRWHRHVNVCERRHAAAAALAATALPSLVLARGHRIEQVREVPLVVENSMQQLQKTSRALQLLQQLGCGPELQRVAAIASSGSGSSQKLKLRSGKGKMRGRRRSTRRGPLLVYADDEGLTRAFRNIPGVDCCHVDKLSVLQLAPGGALGRFCIWSSSAFKRLQLLYGKHHNNSASSKSIGSHTAGGGAALKKGYHLPRPLMSNADLGRLINSEEIQAVVRPAKKPAHKRATVKKNLLKNHAVLCRVNPAAAALKRLARLAQTVGSRQHTIVKKKKQKTIKERKEHRKAAKAFVKEINDAFADKMREELQHQAEQKAELAGAIAQASKAEE